ncbi:aspartic proteinase Asp1 [Medicago truncatula]|uniref:Aspartic proteinase Asp1 n=1 Tax=Medicago truncatula TaxID=3880 RepID=A0A072VQV6_MEDTR|nr:aspartic proteinase Asp1 [Medicago truncatula]KEH40515.1 eukaryotic aspartyl protease family protein [Medicago truncatula]
MDFKTKPFITLFLFLLFSSIFSLTFSAANKPFSTDKSHRVGSSAVFRVHGNVYPLGYYTVSLNIGYPPKLYDLDIDSGSDLTWVQCDAPCKGCTKPRDQLYKPSNNLVQCVDQLCAAVHLTSDHHCSSPDEQCDYEVEYADQGSSLGVLVRDYVPLQFTNGSVIRPRIAFGCGYDQKHSGTTSPPSTTGVLGLGNGRTSILSQLHSLGLIRNVVGHCLSGRGGGFLFFGDDLIPSSGIVWTPMLPSSSEKHYSLGQAELLFNGKPTTIKGLDLIFDSGSSYTYFNSKAYQTIVDQVTNDLKGNQLKRATEDPSLPICWKGSKSFKTVSDVKNYFKPLALRFKKVKNSQMLIPPEGYLIVTKHGNVCLGILDGTEVGLGDLNIIGDISLQDKMVIYDNERQQIGWISYDCDRIPNIDRDFEDDAFPHPYAANFGIFDDRCAA